MLPSPSVNGVTRAVNVPRRVKAGMGAELWPFPGENQVDRWPTARFGTACDRALASQLFPLPSRDEAARFEAASPALLGRHGCRWQVCRDALAALPRARLRSSSSTEPGWSGTARGVTVAEARRDARSSKVPLDRQQHRELRDPAGVVRIHPAKRSWVVAPHGPAVPPVPVSLAEAWMRTAARNQRSRGSEGGRAFVGCSPWRASCDWRLRAI